MPLQRGCQQPGRVHQCSLCFYSLCHCLPSLKHFPCLLLPSLSTRLIICFTGLREQSNVMYYFVLEVGQHSKWFLDIWSCPFQSSIQILYPFFFYLFTTILFMTKCKPWELLPNCFLQSHTCVTHSTSGCAKVTRHGSLVILKAFRLALRRAFSPLALWDR